MLRAVASVIVGYFVMVLVVFLGFTAAYVSIGQANTFRPNSLEVTPLWLGIALTISTVAALAGGVTARLIARTSTPVRVLAVLVLVFGLLSAGLQMAAPPVDPADIPATISSLEAAGLARQPVWYGIVVAVIGAIGVMIGGAVVRRPATD